jgi:mannose-1-phosphate guanylyltransferase
VVLKIPSRYVNVQDKPETGIMIGEASNLIRCGIVLAGGEGQRLRPFIRRFRTDDLPKQYVNLIGTHTMLERTFHRAEKLIRQEHLFTVVSQAHLRYAEVRSQLSGRPKGTVVVQPENKETAPGLLLPLSYLYKRFPDATVVVLPSDHFILEEGLFTKYLALACRVVETDPSRFVLLGMQPNEPEPEYGYILPDEKTNDLSVHNVLRFVEKPQAPAAREIIAYGGLWNTMIMVFKAKTLMDLVRTTARSLYRSFKRIIDAIETSEERAVVEETYRNIEPLNFSSGFLEALPLSNSVCLSVLPVKGVYWSDLGSEQRLLSALQKTGYAVRIKRISERGHFVVRENRPTRLLR